MTTPTRYLVTGGNGFLGSHLVERLRAIPGSVVFAPPVSEFDLLSSHVIPAMLRKFLEALDWYLAARCQ